MAGEQDKLLDHNYDGIQEYDNDLPRWWVAMFWGWIVFGVIYVVLYHFGSWQFTSEQLAGKLEEVEQMKIAAAPPVAPGGKAFGESDMLQLASLPATVDKGKEHWTAKCVACHLDDGRGLVGPNLTDPYWIHGGGIMDIRNVIVNGVIEKGMVPWKDLMTNDEINEVTAFVWSLRDTNVEGKEPQGERYEDGKLVVEETPAGDESAAEAPAGSEDSEVVEKAQGGNSEANG